jgi:anhydro-N-acetylmuramic acid kinase
MLSIGLMSGTSMDGVDAALLETDGSPQSVKELANLSIPYPLDFKLLLKAAEYCVRQCDGDLSLAKTTFTAALRQYLTNELNIMPHNIETKLAELANYLHGSSEKTITFDDIIQHSTFFHVQAAKALLEQAQLTAADVHVVGYHGQTLFHQPKKQISIIIGDGKKLAYELGITVVSEFRRRDIEAGGLGAPFAPLYHQALAVRDQKLPLVVVNCGGIANVTWIADAEKVTGFDTGPGNALIDTLVRRQTQGKKNMDHNGEYAQQGKVNEIVLQALYQHSTMQEGKNYFALLPPKSLDYGDMKLITAIDSLSMEDACATLAAFTACTIVDSVDFFNTATLPARWILAGGGWNNPVILRELKQRLIHRVGKHCIIQTADEVGWNSQYIEAQLFAYLAVRSLQGQPLSLPSTTGVQQALTGGERYIPTHRLAENNQSL